MKLNELPQDIQNKLIADRNNWKGHIASGSYGVTAYNQNGTRFFSANRRCIGWQHNEYANCSMPFGGGTYWEIKYGQIQWTYKRRKDPLGETYTEYQWVRSKYFCRTTNEETGEVVEIPTRLNTKKEVMALLKKLEFMGFKNLSNDPFESPQTIEIYNE